MPLLLLPSSSSSSSSVTNALRILCVFFSVAVYLSFHVGTAVGASTEPSENEFRNDVTFPPTAIAMSRTTTLTSSVHPRPMEQQHPLLTHLLQSLRQRQNTQQQQQQQAIKQTQRQQNSLASPSPSPSIPRNRKKRPYPSSSSPSPLPKGQLPPTRGRPAKKPRSASSSSSKRDKAANIRFDKQCPTSECQARLTDCMVCLGGVPLSRCQRFTRLTFGILRRPSSDVQQRRRERIALSKLLIRAKPVNDSTYCQGFVSTYANPSRKLSLDIGTKAAVNTVGLGVILRQALNNRFGSSTVRNITSFVVYTTVTTTTTTTTTVDENEKGEKVKKQVVETTTTTVDTDETKVAVTGRKLYGQLRLPTASKHVIKADGSLRVWKIRQILRTLPKRQNWANVFSNYPGSFKVVVKNGKTFLVFVNFSKTFKEEH